MSCCNINISNKDLYELDLSDLGNWCAANNINKEELLELARQFKQLELNNLKESNILDILDYLVEINNGNFQLTKQMIRGKKNDD